MIRHNRLREIVAQMAAPSAIESVYPEPIATSEHLLEIGGWLFQLPGDWLPDQHHHPVVPYFESSDGSKGCYVTTLALKPLYRTAAEIAECIQRSHRRSLEMQANAQWHLMHESQSATNEIAHSTLDLFDWKKRYRVLNKVIARTDRAVQLTLHDYCCKNYSASVQCFEHIAESVRAR